MDGARGAWTRARGAGSALLVVTPLWLGGCTPGIATDVAEPLRPPGSMSVTRLALMPVTTPDGSQAFRPLLDRDLVLALRERHPNMEILESGAVLGAFRRGGVAEDYARLVEDYERAGAVDPARSRRIIDALGVTHFLQVRVGYRHEVVLDPDLWSDDLSPEDWQEVVAIARLWGPGSVSPEWEAVITTWSRTGEFTVGRRSPHELVTELADSIAARSPIR